MLARTPWFGRRGSLIIPAGLSGAGLCTRNRGRCLIPAVSRSATAPMRAAQVRLPGRGIDPAEVGLPVGLPDMATEPGGQQVIDITAGCGILNMRVEGTEDDN